MQWIADRDAVNARRHTRNGIRFALPTKNPEVRRQIPCIDRYL